jgi:trk system potassium uptake protein TrkH
MYLLTVSSWLVVCIFAALPFLLTAHQLHRLVL